MGPPMTVHLFLLCSKPHSPLQDVRFRRSVLVPLPFNKGQGYNIMSNFTKHQHSQSRHVDYQLAKIRTVADFPRRTFILLQCRNLMTMFHLSLERNGNEEAVKSLVPLFIHTSCDAAYFKDRI